MGLIQKHSGGSRVQIPVDLSDEYHPNVQSAYLWTREWRSTRRAKLDDVGYRCRVCKQSKDLQVHHLTYDHVGHEWLEELIVLCRGCHQSVHEQRDAQRKRRRSR